MVYLIMVSYQEFDDPTFDTLVYTTLSNMWILWWGYLIL